MFCDFTVINEEQTKENDVEAYQICYPREMILVFKFVLQLSHKLALVKTGLERNVVTTTMFRGKQYKKNRLSTSLGLEIRNIHGTSYESRRGA